MTKIERKTSIAISAAICLLPVITVVPLLLKEPQATATEVLELSKPLEYRIEIQETVADVSTRRQREEIKCLKEALWHEARGESDEGLKAVLTVIINRANHPDYPATFCKVIRQPKQFSYIEERKHQGLPLAPKPQGDEQQVLKKIEMLATSAVTGGFNRTLPAGVLWYHSLKVKPGWARTKLKAASIGRHVFYRKKDSGKFSKGEQV